MTFIFVIFFRKYDSSHDFETDKKEFTNEKNKIVNNIVFYNIIINSLFNSTLPKISKSHGKDYEFLEEEKSSKLDEDELKEMRRIRLLDIMLWSILNEVGIYSVFLMVLYAISFFNLNNSSFVYNQLFLSTFVNQQSQSELGLNNVFVFFLFISFYFHSCPFFCSYFIYAYEIFELNSLSPF